MILVDYKAAVGKMNDLVRIAKGVSKEVAKMEDEIEELGIFWNSSAMEEYAIRLNAELYNTKALIEKIKNSIKLLYEVICSFDEAERKVMNMIEFM